MSQINVNVINYIYQYKINIACYTLHFYWITPYEQYVHNLQYATEFN